MTNPPDLDERWDQLHLDERWNQLLEAVRTEFWRSSWLNLEPR